MMTHKIFQMPFAKIYSCYVTKLERKNKNSMDLDHIIVWLTGYSEQELVKVVNDEISLALFFEQAPQLNQNWQLITGKICGQSIETIQDPLMRKIRCLDKLVDELAKGKSLEKLLV
ncbi:DUF2200 domain-containing protein [Streptococcus sp. sy004]|uniref:DUF2200 domain-containing protein n=1 Tax=Streptococcus sp. sy004 TaxID=2600149 RepID=UPI0011B38232|nr:DUF2200 domain-containing protein [Streptococcus sp. sy004]TWT12408.1 DUF2200 domain-containing protein [Streptococcus sp. sy004]